MVTAVQAFIDAHDAGSPAVAADWLTRLPRYQVKLRFAEVAARCPERIALAVERRPGNALNVEIGTPLPRCKRQPPIHWGDNAPSVTRWVRSGGSPLVLGPCACASCPIGRDK